MTDNKDDTTQGEPEAPVASHDILDDAEQVVAAFGGIRPMATRLGVAATTIQGWKSRGNIPQNRREVVLEAATANGIDLSAAVHVPIDDAPEDAAPAMAELASPVQAPPPSAQKSNSGIAWLALLVAVGTGAAVLTQPKWTPLVFEETPAGVPSGLEARITALESKPSVPDMSRRVVAAEQVLNELRAREPALVPPDLTPRLNALSARLDALTQTLESTRTEGRAAIDVSASDIVALRAAFETLSAKVENAAVQTAAANAQGSAAVLAVGALEVVLGGGLPYVDAIGAIERLAPSNDKKLMEPIGILKPNAAKGIPTRPQLTRRLSVLAASRGTPLWSAEGQSWTDKLLQKIDTVVAIRRVDDGADSRAQADLLVRAAAASDLPDAIAALEGATGAGADWARDAQNRIAAEQALAALRLRAIERLGDTAESLGR